MLKQDESLAKELVAPQFYPQSHHGTLSTHSMLKQVRHKVRPFAMIKVIKRLLDLQIHDQLN